MISHRRRWLGFGLVAMAAFVVATREVAAQEVIDAKRPPTCAIAISQTWTPCTSRSCAGNASRRTSTLAPAQGVRSCPRC